MLCIKLIKKLLITRSKIMTYYTIHGTDPKTNIFYNHIDAHIYVTDLVKKILKLSNEGWKDLRVEIH